MKYKCNKCSKILRGNNGRLLANLPAQLRSAYPVDPWYAKEGATWHLKASFTNVMEKLVITHGNDEQLCTMMSELKGDNHFQYQAEYLSQARDTNATVTHPPVGFKDWIGPYSPSGQDLRDLKLQRQHSHGLVFRKRTECFEKSKVLEPVKALVMTTPFG